jgi:putative chitinase
MKLTARIIVVGAGSNPSAAALWLEPLQAACDKFDINTPNRVAAFLANVGVESNGLTALVEDMNYTAKGLANTWPSRYAENPNGQFYVPNATSVELAGRPQDIANNVYASRMGNGAASTGDGWEYIGRGPIQLTGKANYERFFEAMDLPEGTDPDALTKPQLGAMSAAWIFSDFDCNELADEGEIGMVIEKINGRSPRAANQGPLRESRYNDVVTMLSAA